MAEKKKARILFLCTGNACRSQMAEGWARYLYGDRYDVYSAGIEKHGLNLRAVQVMAEAAVDISHHESALVGELPVQEFDLVITLCGHAHENCPVFSGGGPVMHHGFDDPPKLAANARSEKEVLGHYRRVRDEIRDFIRQMPALLNNLS